MNIGNVYKLKTGNIVIISNVGDDNTFWISFSFSSVSGITPNITYETTAMCWDCDINDGGEKDESCETCHGTGNYTSTIYGMDNATKLADNVKSYIVDKLTQNFDW